MVTGASANRRHQWKNPTGAPTTAWEETIYDPRTGHPINNNFADYLVAVNTDAPAIECMFLDYPDTVMNEYGARGFGEIGLTGCASAIGSATYHATGVRVRELAIRIERLLESTAGCEQGTSIVSLQCQLSVVGRHYL
jgi:CO/xanthine dehydrogenase Mo-binding subunit